MRYISIIRYAGMGILFIVMNVQAQEKEMITRKGDWRAGVVMANTHVPQGTVDGKKVMIIPTWGLDLSYYPANRWAVSLQTDLELQSFEVEENSTVLERSYPVLVALVGKYLAGRHWGFYIGPGYEFEKNRNLFLIRTGVEYSFEINRRWELGLNLVYENKETVYDVWAFGIVFSRLLNARPLER